ncbi:Hypp7634 [Branchiostoma lanceolatum]|uniref:Hypp7634 protein n=1 Tax=Branchiostoma lanceolatum TaxID=7740 RepID=A0A8J9Z1R5_BRALA|nr:Hypp7634 [Branchiostoma lanceolatum]
MPHVCDICDKEFSRKFNLVRHRDTIHGDRTKKSSAKESTYTETSSYRSADIFDDTDNPSDQETTGYDTEPLESSEGNGSTTSQETVIDSADEGSAVTSSQEEPTETDNEADSESETGSRMSDTSSSNENKADSESQEDDDSSGDPEWTLYRDWTVQQPRWEADVPQRVIKETKRAGKTRVVQRKHPSTTRGTLHGAADLGTLLRRRGIDEANTLIVDMVMARAAKISLKLRHLTTFRGIQPSLFRIPSTGIYPGSGTLTTNFTGGQEEKPDYDIPGNYIQLDSSDDDSSDEPHAGEDNPDQNALLDMPDEPHEDQDNSDQNALPDMYMSDESFDEDNPDQNVLLDMPDEPHVGQDNSDQNALPDMYMSDESFDEDTPDQNALLDMPDEPHVGQDNSDQNALPDMYMSDESFEIFIQRQMSLLQHLNATLEFDPSD